MTGPLQDLLKINEMIAIRAPGTNQEQPTPEGHSYVKLMLKPLKMIRICKTASNSLVRMEYNTFLEAN